MPTHALPYLFDEVTAYFAAHAAAQVPVIEPAPNLWGERARSKHIASSSGGLYRRVVWIPGSDGGGGRFTAPKFPGRNPPAIWNHVEPFTVLIDVVDTSAKESERAQYEAAKDLLELWARAIDDVSRANHRITSIRYPSGDAERRHGFTITVSCEVDATIALADYGEVTPTAIQNTSHLDPAPDDEGEIDVVEDEA